MKRAASIVLALVLIVLLDAFLVISCVGEAPDIDGPGDGDAGTEGGVAPSDGGDSATAPGDASTAPGGGGRVLFVTSAAVTGNVTLAGADATCNELAASGHAALQSKVFLAWLSAPDVAARDRHAHGTGPYVRIDGAVVAMDWNELTSGTIREFIDRDETNASVNYNVWTGTAADGSATGSSCGGWTSQSGSGTIGSTRLKGGAWTNALSLGCGSENHLYCIEK